MQSVSSKDHRNGRKCPNPEVFRREIHLLRSPVKRARRCRLRVVPGVFEGGELESTVGLGRGGREVVKTRRASRERNLRA